MVSKADLENALKDAMRARDATRKSTLRLVLTAIKLGEVDKGAPLDEAEILALLQKELKMRQETISEAERAGRDQIVEETQAEIEVLREFLPAPLAPDELEALARSVIAEVGATSMTDMGTVMKTLTPRLQGRASGKDASDIVRRLLQPN
ncbi:MAG: GatB/YqeY domain-containing protein [Anaerolineales bacterium]|jgi:hypothetical protein